MLVYRDFAEQAPDRSYLPGPVLRPTTTTDAPIDALRLLGPPHLRRLVDVVDESANLMVLAGLDTRFLATVETQRVLRVGDRSGKALPAHLTSGGVAILAASPEALIDEVVETAGIDGARFVRRLSSARQCGYAINDGNTEDGVTAIGVAVRDEHGTATAAISVAMPSTRYAKHEVDQIVGPLQQAARHLGDDLRSHAGR